MWYKLLSHIYVTINSFDYLKNHEFKITFVINSNKIFNKVFNIYLILILIEFVISISLLILLKFEISILY